MKTFIKFLATISIVFFVAGSVNAGVKDPVAMLYKVKGSVEYSKNGKKWKKVRRKKFLFAGYQLRSGANGSGRITIKKTGERVVLNPNSLLEVNANGLMAKEGQVSAAKKTNKLVAGLIKRFERSQSYTTVVRAANKGEIKLKVIRDIVVSDQHPYMVWDNIGKEYTYKLAIGETLYDVQPTKDDVIRVKLDPFEGKAPFKISVIKDGNVITEVSQYKKRGKKIDHTVRWLSNDESSSLMKTKTALIDEYGEDSFILGTYFEKEDMWVAAMDHYKSYLSDNPDEIEMTPYLFRVYRKLKLMELYKKERTAYLAAVE